MLRGMASPMTGGFRWESDRMVRAFLATHEASCPRCDYSLRALESSECPECGTRLALGITTDSRAKNPWPKWVTVATNPVTLTVTASIALVLARGPAAAAVPYLIWTLVFATLAFGRWMRGYVSDPMVVPPDRFERVVKGTLAAAVFVVAAAVLAGSTLSML